MHFWIDKRSQGCGFGRARGGFVAASLSGSGYDYHPPRRNKSMLTPVHRFPAVDCRANRPNVHRSNYHHHHHHHQDHHHQHHPNRTHHHETHAEVTHHNTTYGEPADYSVMQQYQSHLPIELEQGTLGMNAIRTSEILTDDRATLSANVAEAVNATDSQILPSHLKCGMWASLALATVFLAAFQGSGLEILIFCAFSATFFVAACTVSLCRRPRNIQIPQAQLSAVTTNVNDIEIAHMDQHEPHVPNVIDPIAPPPPYHIAILESQNDNPKIDDSPPPSYDKLII